MTSNATPTVKVLIGNSSSSIVMPVPVSVNLISAFSKAARRLLGAAAGTRKSPLQVRFSCSNHWSPDIGGMHFIFMWLTRTQTHNGILQFRPITNEVAQANQMPLGGVRFDQLLRLCETLLILEPDNILAYQIATVRGRITNIVSKNVLSPGDFAMLVNIFRAPPSQDMALVNFAISKAWEQVRSGQLPFIVGCAVYRTILQSQLPCPHLPGFRKAILSYIDTKLTLEDFLASLDSICRVDPNLGNHAVEMLVLKEVEGSAESIELDKRAAVNPKLVAAIHQIRLERDKIVQWLVARPPRASEPDAAPPANSPQSQQLGLASAPQKLLPSPVLTPLPATRPIASSTPNRRPNLIRSKTYQPSTLGPNANQRHTRQPSGTASSQDKWIPSTSSPWEVIHGNNEQDAHGLNGSTRHWIPQPAGHTTSAISTAGQSGNIGQLGTQASFRNLSGIADETEEELKARTKIAESRSMMKFEHGKWVQGQPGQWKAKR
ncbi:hypothetical protein E2P81_ATG02116 [Venturia nashicola]|uniref:Uncharacterized protein n=1 Tax=Venturia nashicola TaxID=86259 RepID=A0A4Z1P2Q6_9PEZI|nr:hypothetical protein E6O75_ATG02167 [Venturia nashicola]TLD35813.1 hypothetical protein E2P81_ATG02116 [Venturia nashicola]